MNVYSSQLCNYIETQLTETVITSYSISEQDGLTLYCISDRYTFWGVMLCFQHKTCRFFLIFVKFYKPKAGEMVQWLRRLAALGGPEVSSQHLC